MTISDAFFISTTLHKRSVTLPDGSAHELHFKELPAIEFAKFHEERKSDDGDVRAAAAIRLICASLCEPNGKPALSPAKASQLKSEAMNALMEAVLSVNRPADLGNASAPAAESGSGTSSP
ncbi:hypothetical protein [Lysobacter sp. Root96]|uniref:hypothetical protein n=1 Tax=Lysobacter sp. Root96 TaxID=1736612 RepID=UPI0006F5013B|nr:hypothetical protein [Lysobacter sp. Root96]KRD71450.1 hypothetical protein ASE45_06475 [Lysobacter sp. Root96]